MYTIGEVSKLSGVTLRTLRYYDQIGLLSPQRAGVNDYRLYGKAEINRLQQILFYREFDMKLSEIQEILDDKDFDVKQSLKSHRTQLLEEQKRISRLIQTIDQSIQESEGEIKMKDTEKFEGFKEQLLAENEKEFGEEIRSKYGEDVAKKSNQKFNKMSESEYHKWDEQAVHVMELLKKLVLSPHLVEHQLGMQVAVAHQKWLQSAWSDVLDYNVEKHLNLAEMYLMDNRFTAFYDESAGKGATKLLVESLKNHL